MKKRILSLILLVISISSSSMADHKFVGYRKLAQIISDYTIACNVNTCQEPFGRLTLFKRGENESNVLSAQEYSNLKRVASAQAQIWADTILESDYITDNETKLVEVTGIIRSNELVAYQIRYSERAWDLSTCEYDPKIPSSITACTEGVVEETSFVSLDFKNFVRNQNEIADFYH